MGKNILKILVAIIASILLVACTQQMRVRTFGDTMEVKLPPGHRLMVATWKDSDLYYLLEPMDSNYTPKVKHFIENSSFGIIESQIIFIESR